MKQPGPNAVKLLHLAAHLAALLAIPLLLAGCRHQQKTAYTPPPPDASSTYSTNRSQRKASNTKQAPAPEPVPDVASVHGKPVSTEVGMASWYGPPYANRKGANGLVYNQNAMTAAHRTLPFGTLVRVTNLSTGQSAMVRITDRGPFVHGRVLDLSLAAAKATGVYRAGVAKVKIEVFPSQQASTGSGHWCVQVGAFTHPGNATELKNDLSRRYHTAKVIEFAGPTGHWVRINPADPDKRHADEIAQAIRPKEPDAEAYVIRLN